MGRLVAAFALSHAPGVTGWPEQAEPSERERFLAGCAELARRLSAARPDVLVGIGNDHVLNFFLDNTPDFCVGTGARHEGPAEFFKEWLALPDYAVAGHAEFAAALVRGVRRRGIRLAFSERILMDDNFSVPLHLLTPRMDVPFVPMPMNCIVPPLPSNETCYALGRLIRRVVEEERPAEERVAFMATGGLSHDPGGPRYFQIDEAFDRWFLGLLEKGEPEAVLREVTFERMLAAGDGGTTECLSWMVALGAAEGRPAEVLAYEPIRAWRCGMGVVDFRLD